MIICRPVDPSVNGTTLFLFLIFVVPVYKQSACSTSRLVPHTFVPQIPQIPTLVPAWSETYPNMYTRTDWNLCYCQWMYGWIDSYHYDEYYGLMIQDNDRYNDE